MFIHYICVESPWDRWITTAVTFDTGRWWDEALASAVLCLLQLDVTLCDRTELRFSLFPIYNTPDSDSLLLGTNVLVFTGVNKSFCVWKALVWLSPFSSSGKTAETVRRAGPREVFFFFCSWKTMRKREISECPHPFIYRAEPHETEQESSIMWNPDSYSRADCRQ